MVFSSSLFLVYFLPLFITIYILLPRVAKNPFILVSSIFFYAWGAPDFIFIVLGTIVADFYIVKLMHHAQGKKKIWWASFSVILNIGLLGYFKYANFFVDNINYLFEAIGWQQVKWMEVALPIGISFFTFQKITYAIDVYRKVHEPLSKVTDYAMYILMFPQLIAGPIVRYNEIAGQIVDRREHENTSNRITGFFRFIIGLAKKVLIANVLGEQVDLIFAVDPGSLTTATAWLGVIAYAFQIYFDFSGYSDMAIGIGRMIGFKFPENFNNPYVSQSITEFWRRWHITLGRFMKNYLYIPLGGNRVSTPRLFFNLWIVFLISGLWHGAAWNFVIWGAFHGLFLVLDRLFLLKFYKKIGKIPSVVITFFISLVGWVFFRSETLPQALTFLEKMFSANGNLVQVDTGQKFIFIFILAVIFSFMAVVPGVEKWQENILGYKEKLSRIVWMTLFSILFYFICLASVTSSGFNPFIYFRF